MTNSAHRHKWIFLRDCYFGCLYAGTLRVKGEYHCSCGKRKYGKPNKTAEQIALEELEDSDG